MNVLIKHVVDVDVEDEYIIVNKDDTLAEISKRFEEKYIADAKFNDQLSHPILSAYIVEGGKPIGIINKDDIITEVIVNGRDPKKVTAKEIMKNPICYSINDTVQDVVNDIIDRGVLTVAICDGKKLVSVISVYDAIFLYQEADEI